MDLLPTAEWVSTVPSNTAPGAVSADTRRCTIAKLILFELRSQGVKPDMRERYIEHECYLHKCQWQRWCDFHKYYSKWCSVTIVMDIGLTASLAATNTLIEAVESWHVRKKANSHLVVLPHEHICCPTRLKHYWSNGYCWMVSHISNLTARTTVTVSYNVMFTLKDDHSNPSGFINVQ
jgi:hypothetical protein